MLNRGIIVPSNSPYSSPVLFQKKHNGTLRSYVDYRSLNKITMKNKYNIPLMGDLFNRLGGTIVFTKIDLKIGYWQVTIAEGDEHKTTCMTLYGSFDFLVMPFHLTNALATFCTLMSQVFREYIDEFVVVYLDCIDFLGHFINKGLINMDQHKVQAITDWMPPKDIHALRLFLGTMQLLSQVHLKQLTDIYATERSLKEGHVLGLVSQAPGGF
uniref:RNA-directed DNA polymerase homolog n=1 Tax=Nicotiana tabacum TaxID=4097 RepID=A0A1S3XCT8_TOBAC|nr:PREDICTED: RNA-directed DNA polymerase homolog [Nicotiana tabacum]